MIWDYILLAIIVLTALLAVVVPNIVYAVLFLLCTNVSLGILYYMMGAPLVSVFQLAIFAGAIVVFFLITVILTRGGEIEGEREGWRLLSLSSTALILLSAVLLLSLSLNFPFPIWEYTSLKPSWLISLTSFKEISRGICRLIWGKRGLDVLGQAFVILAAILCCLAMLKSGGED
ncbi:NADH-quinone oxidoreductase subunit J [Candidatus Bathyarchaeota archaeon]|nr:NADH-quinone oxidoreductase subunit J [Candidatus Bathyarchaeota archaeon]